MGNLTDKVTILVVLSSGGLIVEEGGYWFSVNYVALTLNLISNTCTIISCDYVSQFMEIRSVILILLDDKINSCKSNYYSLTAK